MTIKVYRVYADGRRSTAGGTVIVPKGDGERLPETLVYPKCTCPRCSSRAVS